MPWRRILESRHLSTLLVGNVSQEGIRRKWRSNCPSLMVTIMANKTQSERDGGYEFHVADCYVWAAIYYLDSPTNYREYLPANVRPVQRKECNEQMVLLDDEKRPHFLKSFSQLFFYCSIITLVGVFLFAIVHD